MCDLLDKQCVNAGNALMRACSTDSANAVGHSVMCDSLKSSQKTARTGRSARMASATNSVAEMVPDCSAQHQGTSVRMRLLRKKATKKL